MHSDEEGDDNDNEDAPGEDFEDFAEGAEVDDFGDFDDGFQEPLESESETEAPTQSSFSGPPSFVSD